jgi:hypothetical protein
MIVFVWPCVYLDQLADPLYYYFGFYLYNYTNCHYCNFFFISFFRTDNGISIIATIKTAINE